MPTTTGQTDSTHQEFSTFTAAEKDADVKNKEAESARKEMIECQDKIIGLIRDIAGHALDPLSSDAMIIINSETVRLILLRARYAEKFCAANRAFGHMLRHVPDADLEEITDGGL